jgi:hypothetical protein
MVICWCRFNQEALTLSQKARRRRNNYEDQRKNSWNVLISECLLCQPGSNPEVLAKATRRCLTLEYKLEILEAGRPLNRRRPSEPN